MTGEVERFEEQGGSATSDPSPILRWLSSKMMRRMADRSRLDKRRAKFEAARLKSGQPHVVEYFHQIDDGYSHLAAQLLQLLQERYDIQLVCHLVPGPTGKNAPEPELLLDLARVDAARIAPHYGLRFPQATTKLTAADVAKATGILASADPEQFASLAPAVGEALWSTSPTDALKVLSVVRPADDAEVAEKLRAGNERRARLKHYSGGMFYYGDEWYWGVDRLYHLEQRLIDLGAARSNETLLAPRPDIVDGPLKDNGSLTLEIYPSLRSPYTSIIFDRTVELARETGVNLSVRPVLPMVMRGVPATREKGMYIFSDTAREARTLGLEWGNAYDPIGEPVRRCYSLYSWARDQGKGVQLVSAFLNAAFFNGINTNNDTGMRRVVENAGLSWAEAQSVIGNRDWEEEIEANRLAMYGFGSWGVPSYRLLDESGNSVLALWGQDRLWLYAREIQRLLADRAASGG